MSSQEPARNLFFDRLALWLSGVLSPFVCAPFFCTLFAHATARSTRIWADPGTCPAGWNDTVTDPIRKGWP